MAAHVVGKFGWEKNYLPAPWILLLWLMLGALLCSEPNPLPSRKRWGLLAITAMYVAAFAITMYLLWSAVGADKMDNWQGRYFLPVAPVLMLALAQGRLKKWKKEINALAFVILLLSNLAMVWSVWERYYWG